MEKVKVRKITFSERSKVHTWFGNELYPGDLWWYSACGMRRKGRDLYTPTDGSKPCLHCAKKEDQTCQQ